MTDTLRPKGRALADFSPLLPAEEKLLKAVLCGEPCIISDTLPEAPTDTNRIRANFLRFLLLGGDEFAPVHEKGVRLQGAWIEEEVVLDFAKEVCHFTLIKCNVLCGMSGLKAHLTGIHFSESHMGPLCFDGAHISGTVLFRDGCHATGLVNFSGAEIGGQFDCVSSRFSTKKNAALPATDPAGDTVLLLDLAVIKGSLFLGCKQESTIFEGKVSLAGAQVRMLADDPKSWSPVIVLNGCTYDYLEGPMDAKTRLEWLDLQPEEHGGKEAHRGKTLRPHPYQQLAAVLRAMGHAGDARKILIDLEQKQIRNRPWWERLFLIVFWDLPCACGYNPWRLVGILALIWFGCGLFYWLFYWGQVGAPAYPFVYSLENMIRLFDFGQRAAWTPPSGVIWLVWAQHLLGVIGLGLAGLMLSGLLKRD